MKDPVVVEREIVIAAPPEEVFAFVSGYQNDPRWRAEVERMEHPWPLKVGDTVTEYSTFNGRMLAVPTVLVARDEHERAHLVTPDDFAHRLENIRMVEAVDDHSSRFTYHLAYELEILRPVMVVLPPSVEVASWYGAAVERYLATLKKLIEDGRAASAG
jgi:hypothetical protein